MIYFKIIHNDHLKTNLFQMVHKKKYKHVSLITYITNNEYHNYAEHRTNTILIN